MLATGQRDHFNRIGQLIFDLLDDLRHLRMRASAVDNRDPLVVIQVGLLANLLFVFGFLRLLYLLLNQVRVCIFLGQGRSGRQRRVDVLGFAVFIVFIKVRGVLNIGGQESECARQKAKGLACARGRL